MRIGTIAGRHPLPVERNILQGQVNPGQEAYDQAFSATKDLVRELLSQGVDHIDLFYTGLTEITIAVLDALQDEPVSVTVWRYDSVASEYMPLRRGAPDGGKR